MRYALFVIPLFTSCTFSIIMTDTHGIADDVVDSTPTNKTDVEAEIPLTPAI